MAPVQVALDRVRIERVVRLGEDDLKQHVAVDELHEVLIQE
jgi:hypothetical protein